VIDEINFDIQRIRQERNMHLDARMFRPVRVEGQRNSESMTKSVVLGRYYLRPTIVDYVATGTGMLPVPTRHSHVARAVCETCFLWLLELLDRVFQSHWRHRRCMFSIILGLHCPM
jgi:hypothetical protein